MVPTGFSSDGPIDPPAPLASPGVGNGNHVGGRAPVPVLSVPSSTGRMRKSELEAVRLNPWMARMFVPALSGTASGAISKSVQSPLSASLRLPVEGEFHIGFVGAMARATSTPLM